MQEERSAIQRKGLHKQVWSKPIIKLAKEYGLSDVGLKKICKKLNVLTPTRGYWAKIYGGQKPLPASGLLYNSMLNQVMFALHKN